MQDITVEATNPTKTKHDGSKGFKIEVSQARNEVAISKIQAEVEELAKDLEPELDIEEITHINNKEKLEAIIGKEENIMNDGFANILTSTLIGLTLAPGFSAICIPIGYSAYKLLEKAQRLQQIKNLVQTLMDEFKNEHIEVFPCLEIEGMDNIDLFIRFPDKIFFMVSLQAIGKNTLFYSPHAASEKQRDGLYLRNEKGRRKDFRPKKLELLPKQEKILRQQHKNILGGSSKDTRSGIVKILGICGEDAKLTHHFPAELTEINNGKKFYLAQKNPSIFVMRDQEIIKFIKIKIHKKRF